MEDLSVHYQALAKSLMMICQPGFTRAEIVAEVDTAYSEVLYNCETPAGMQKGLDSPFELDRVVDKTLHALRREMQSEGARPWSGCKFTLYPDGNFKFDVVYND